MIKIASWEVDHLARVAHEVNRAYCQSIGDDSQVPYDQAPEWQKESAREGVLKALDASTMPGDSHRSWSEHKVRDGWTYGPVKDPEAKTHPCLVPFEQLPVDQQAKDFLFLAAVRSARFVQVEHKFATARAVGAKTVPASDNPAWEAAGTP